VVASAVVLLPKVLSTRCVQSLRSFKSSLATTATAHCTTIHITTSLTSYKQTRLKNHTHQNTAAQPTRSTQHSTAQYSITHTKHRQHNSPTNTARSKAGTYSSPILRTSNRPQPVPMSLSWISSGRFTIVAPATEGSPPRGYIGPTMYINPHYNDINCAECESQYSSTSIFEVI
jgi:hypothetical protein